MQKLFRFFKRFFLGLFVVIILAIVGHWITGYGYILRGIWHTYLSGKTAPGIDEADIFYNRTIASENPKEWPLHPSYGKLQLSKDAKEKLETIRSASFLVFKDGKLAFEKYWDIEPDHPTNSFSAVKSIVGILIGIAMEDGKIKSLDQPVADFLPEFKQGKKKNITIRQLLTMSSGLNWEESGGNPYSDNARAYFGSDLKSHIAELEVEEEPGKIFRYKSGNTQILGFILEAATGMSNAEYLKEKLWTPLNAESDALWNLDHENGNEKSFCCFYSIPKDLARIGQLFLQKGQWNGQQIISEDYINTCITPAKLKTSDGLDNDRYGCHWWTGIHQNNHFYYARGILGQYVIVLPHHKMVIVRTGWDRKNVAQDGHPSDVWEHIHAALEMFQ